LGSPLIENFLFANLPWSIVHFLLFMFVWRCLGHPGYWVARTLGAAHGGVLWWTIMVFNSLLWGGCFTLIVIPLLKKSLK